LGSETNVNIFSEIKKINPGEKNSKKKSLETISGKKILKKKSSRKISGKKILPKNLPKNLKNSKINLPWRRTCPGRRSGRGSLVLDLWGFVSFFLGGLGRGRGGRREREACSGRGRGGRRGGRERMKILQNSKKYQTPE
jgi:hypothetical protein